MIDRIRRRPAPAIGVAGALVVAAVAAFAYLDDSGASGQPQRVPSLSEEAAALPAPHRPAFHLGYVPALRETGDRTRFADVLRAGPVRARPAPDAREVGRVDRHTSLGTTSIVLALGQRLVDGRIWVEVRFPGSNGATGWLPREEIGGYHFVRTRLLVDRRRLTATLFRDGHALLRATVGVGMPQFPTPSGSFYISEKLTSFDDPFYGPVAFGTSARSQVLTDWPDGGSIGIHGTNRPDLLPGRVSHGCIRLRNEDILRLSRLMPVGTPVTIA